MLHSTLPTTTGGQNYVLPDPHHRYSLIALTAGPANLRLRSTAGGNESVEVNGRIDVPSDGVRVVDFDLPDSGITGEVTDERGRPVLRADVEAALLDAADILRNA